MLPTSWRSWDVGGSASCCTPAGSAPPPRPTPSHPHLSPARANVPRSPRSPRPSRGSRPAPLGPRVPPTPSLRQRRGRGAPRRCPRVLNTARQFCPQAGCADRGWLGLNHLCANGHPSVGPGRQWPGTSCAGSCLETHGTIWPGKRGAVARLGRVLAGVAAGLGGGDGPKPRLVLAGGSRRATPGLCSFLSL